MIKDILQQLAPLDEKISALRGDPADENMTDITNHAAELAELSAQEDALLSGCGALTAEDRVFLARHPERPHIDEIVDALFTDFFEQCGDRQCKEDAAILGGVALFHGQPVTVIGHRKGSTLEENLRCNFGMPGPEGILMLENAVYSVLSPEGFASILWKDSSRSGEACEIMKLTAQDLYKDGIVEEIIPEPLGGAQRGRQLLFSRLDTAIAAHLAALCKMSGKALADQRYKKYRRIGEMRGA